MGCARLDEDVSFWSSGQPASLHSALVVGEHHRIRDGVPFREYGMGIAPSGSSRDRTVEKVKIKQCTSAISPLASSINQGRSETNMPFRLIIGQTQPPAVEAGTVHPAEDRAKLYTACLMHESPNGRVRRRELVEAKNAF